MIELVIEPLGNRIPCTYRQTIIDAVRSVGITICATCGGQGTCGHCAVIVIHGDVSTPHISEENTLGLEKIKSGWRLACQTTIQGNVKIYLPPESFSSVHRLQVETAPSPIGYTPGSALSQYGQTRFGSSAIGLAVDLGTTKIAAYLVDIESGKTIDQSGVINPQISYGEDVIARINHTFKEADGAENLQKIVVQALNSLAGELCGRTGKNIRDIEDAVIVGNTAMHHLLIGLSVRSLGLSPYVPTEKKALDIPARQLGLDFSPYANVHFLPNIGGFVGGDHVAMLLGSGMLEKEGVILGLDIGTNTEISLIVNGAHFACSAASGPAFEGAHIRYGLRAISGAIEKIIIHNERVEYKTIDNQPPKGLCGSGILDLVAQMLRSGIIDRKGSMIDSYFDRIRMGKNIEKAFIVVPADQNNGFEITFSRKDVNEIQLAKAAIRTGTSLLLRHAEISEQDITKVVIAGAFGTYLDVQSGMDIGMFPQISKGKFLQVGNAAGTGAKMALLSLERRKRAEELARHVTHVELTKEKNFSSMFARALLFD
ncbi:MAG: DUF4445 domain-containing protein [Proteobacteria bacterium]|nr:DUF4445 domain-containing protein [Pseudomonadota bacterium]